MAGDVDPEMQRTQVRKSATHTPRCVYDDEQPPPSQRHDFDITVRYITQQCFRADIGLPGFEIGPPASFRRPDLDAFPTRIRPKFGPETPLPARKHYCVTSVRARDAKNAGSEIGHAFTRRCVCNYEQPPPPNVMTSMSLYPMLRKSASEPEIGFPGRIWAGF